MAIESVEEAYENRRLALQGATFGQFFRGAVRAPFSALGDPAAFMMGSFKGFFLSFANDTEIPAEAVEAYQAFGDNGKGGWLDSMDAEDMGYLIGATANYTAVSAWMLGSAYCAAVSDLSQTSAEGIANYVVAGGLLVANVLREGHRRLEDYLNRPHPLPGSSKGDNE